MHQARHTQDHVAHYRDHGWVLLEGLLRRDEIEAAEPGLFEVYPTPADFHAGKADFRSEGFKALARSPDNSEGGAKFRPLQFAGLREFPFADVALNLLPLHPAILALMEDLLRTRDVRLYQAETFAKYTGVTQYDQPYHVDYTNHVMLPPRRDGRYAQAQLFLFLSDVGTEHGPTRIVSRRLSDAVPLASINGLGTQTDSDLVRTWEASSTLAVGPKGTLLVYAADIVHRGTDMRLPGGGRFLYSIGYRAAGADWVGSNPWPRKGFHAPWEPLVSACSVRQLEALGFPGPGHPYWDEETLRGAAERYPRLDLEPWREAVAAPPAGPHGRAAPSA